MRQTPLIRDPAPTKMEARNKYAPLVISKSYFLKSPFPLLFGVIIFQTLATFQQVLTLLPQWCIKKLFINFPNISNHACSCESACFCCQLDTVKVLCTVPASLPAPVSAPNTCQLSCVGAEPQSHSSCRTGWSTVETESCLTYETSSVIGILQQRSKSASTADFR